ncbi:MAG TPA: thioredoxin [Gemmatimonadales bacterium]|nr:thioredoxin [Gemmatimonadales bacterium]
MTTTATPSRRVTIRCPVCQGLSRADLSRLADGPKCGRCSRPLLLDRPIKTSDQEFQETIQTAEVPVLVDFYADWCGPCRVMAPTLDEFASERRGEVLVLKLDTDHNPRTAEQFQVRGIPTLIAFRHGQETKRHVGVADRSALTALVGAA